MDRRSERIIIRGGGGQDPIDHDVLVGQADRGELTVRTGDLRQCRLLGAGHEHQSGALGVGQRRHRPGVEGALLVESGQWSQTGCVAPSVGEEVGPGARQLEQPDGVACRCGVEQHVVERADRAVGIGEEFGELVEGGDLGGARSGELFGDRLHLGVGQQPTHGADDAFAVRRGGLFGVDLEGGQTFDCGDCGEGVADGQSEDLADVRRRVRADQQDPVALAGQLNRGGTRDGRLAHPALAGEEHKSWGSVQKLHGSRRTFSSSW